MDAVRCLELVLHSFPKKHPGPKHQWIIGARWYFIPPAQSFRLLTNTVGILRMSKKDTASLSHVREWQHRGKAFVSREEGSMVIEVPEERWRKGWQAGSGWCQGSKDIRCMVGDLTFIQGGTEVGSLEETETVIVERTFPRSFSEISPLNNPKSIVSSVTSCCFLQE